MRKIQYLAHSFYILISKWFSRKSDSLCRPNDFSLMVSKNGFHGRALDDLCKPYDTKPLSGATLIGDPENRVWTSSRWSPNRARPWHGVSQWWLVTFGMASLGNLVELSCNTCQVHWRGIGLDCRVWYQEVDMARFECRTGLEWILPPGCKLRPSANKIPLGVSGNLAGGYRIPKVLDIAI